MAQLGNGEGLNAALGAAASQLAAGQIKEFAQNLADQMTTDPTARDLIANLLTNAVSGGLGYASGGETGSSAASIIDRYNRQLHPEELFWVIAHSKEFAKEQGISEDEAKAILLQQAAMQTDVIWMALLGENYNNAAHDFLKGFDLEVSWDKSTAFNPPQHEFTDPTINSDIASRFISIYRGYISKGVNRNDPLYWLKSNAATGYLLPNNPDDLSLGYALNLLAAIGASQVEQGAKLADPVTRGDAAADIVASLYHSLDGLSNKYMAGISAEERGKLEAIYNNKRLLPR